MKKMTIVNTTRAIQCEWIKIIPIFCQIGLEKEWHKTPPTHTHPPTPKPVTFSTMRAVETGSWIVTNIRVAASKYGTFSGHTDYGTLSQQL